MAFWAAASIAYFVYLAAVALVQRRLTTAGRLKVVAGAAVGILLAAAGGLSTSFWARSFVVPPVTLLLGYWVGGLLWTGPMPRVEAWLARSDERLRIQQLAARLPRSIIALLETAYSGIYPLVPIAFALHVWFSASPDPDRFWSVILITDYVCFGMLPWIQTRPPRSVEPIAPWMSEIRSFNLKLLGRLSIGVNTVPSGHAAEALAAALLLSDAPLPVVAGIWLAAAAVSAGAVFGRYHYAVDAFAGWAVALAVWAAVG